MTDAKAVEVTIPGITQAEENEAVARFFDYVQELLHDDMNMHEDLQHFTDDEKVEHCEEEIEHATIVAVTTTFDKIVQWTKKGRDAAND